MLVVTTGSGHQMVGTAVSVCTTPAAPSPIPLPYPLTASSAEGIGDAPTRTKINGRPILTVGGVISKCHGNEPGTLKEVVSLNTGGPCVPLVGMPTVLTELGMTCTTGSMGLMNKQGVAGGGGGGGGGGSSTKSGNTSTSAAPSSVPVKPEHRQKSKSLLGGRASPEDVALAEAPNQGNPVSQAQKDARERVLRAFYEENGQENALRDELGNLYGSDQNGKPIKKLRKPTNKEIGDQMKGSNLNHPVKVGPAPPSDSPLQQWQAPGNDRGNYFAPAGQTPDQLGINPQGKAWNQSGQPVLAKEATPQKVDPKTPYMQSTSAPVTDTWSVPGQPYQASGGGTQQYMPSGCDSSSPLIA
jgi:hypothetical protein